MTTNLPAFDVRMGKEVYLTDFRQCQRKVRIGLKV
jgi:hypothetical protein